MNVGNAKTFRSVVLVLVVALLVAGCGSATRSSTSATVDPFDAESTRLAPTISAAETAFDPHDPTVIAAITAYAPTRVALQTEEAAQKQEAATYQAEDALRTPSVPEFTSPVTMMFCEGLQQHGQGGAGAALAVVPDGSRVVYKPGTCEPDVSADGSVAVRNDDGSTSRVTPTYTTMWEGNTENVVWTPAKGDLNGVPTIMTAKYLERNAKVAFDQLGQALLDFSMNADGQQVMSALTSRIGGQSNGPPLVIFIDGAPLRAKDGNISAPRVLSTISDRGQTTGLSAADAQRIADGINSGILQ